LFLEQYKPPIVIDEIQYVPELLTYIKIAVDNSNLNGQFWLTGSQMFPLMRGIQESLAGRVRLLYLNGLSQSELAGRENEAFPPSVDTLLKRKKTEGESKSPFSAMLMGGFPRLLTQEMVTRDGFYSSYLQTYLARDVKEITNVLDTGKFLQFVSLVAARTAQELNLASFSRDLGIDGTTVRRWLNILETSGIIVNLPAFSNNLGKRIVRRPKLHFLDIGLACFLCGIEDEEALSKSPIRGALFESWVISEVYKSWWNQGKQPRLFYYRDAAQKEIDLLIDRNSKLYPFEIKLNINSSHVFRNFEVLENMHTPVDFGGAIYSGTELVALKDNYWIIPASLI
jgi:predicted AAA+ superfamily ATPase